MDTWLPLFALLIGVCLGAAVATLMARRRHSGDADPAVVAARHETALSELRAQEHQARSELLSEVATGRATVSALRERVEHLQSMQQANEERERAERRAAAARDESESRVLQALTPVRESLRVMQSTVAELENQRSLQHGELTQQLRLATESEERLRSTAETLASALRSNSTRGVWGETQLRNVVEAAGLLERVDFTVQTSLTSESGAGRPDMVVNLPGGKHIAVDAKVPFTAFLEASAIPPTAPTAEAARRATLLSAHVRAIRGHIDALASKSYWSGLPASPELVIAFIPSESLISSALEADPSLMDYAFSKRVALASPVTLWSVLKTIALSWQQDVLTADAKKLFDLSRELYGRLGTMAGHIEKLGKSLERSTKDYNAFIGSLERSVLPSARKLNALDEKLILGALPVIDEQPRPLTAHEMLPAADPPTTPKSLE